MGGARKIYYRDDHYLHYVQNLICNFFNCSPKSYFLSHFYNLLNPLQIVHKSANTKPISIFILTSTDRRKFLKLFFVIAEVN